MILMWLDTYSRRLGEEPDDAEEHEQRDNLELFGLSQYNILPQ